MSSASTAPAPAPSTRSATTHQIHFDAGGCAAPGAGAGAACACVGGAAAGAPAVAGLCGLLPSPEGWGPCPGCPLEEPGRCGAALGAPWPANGDIWPLAGIVGAPAI